MMGEGGSDPRGVGTGCSNIACALPWSHTGPCSPDCCRSCDGDGQHRFKIAEGRGEFESVTCDSCNGTGRAPEKVS